MRTGTYSRWIVSLTLLTLLLALVPDRSQPSAAQESLKPAPAHQTDEPKNSFLRLTAAQDPASLGQVLQATQVDILHSGSIYTWTQTSQADWEQGTREWLDSTTTPGSLQLARQFFSPNEPLIPLHERASGQWLASVAMDGAGNTYAVWEDDRDGNADIYFAYRPAGGAWGANEKVNDDPGAADQRAPAIAVDGAGNAYALWLDGHSDAGTYDVYFAYRPAGGVWSENAQVNDVPGSAPGPGFLEQVTAIAVDGTGNAYALWTDQRNGDPDIYFAYRPAGGVWGANLRVDDDPGAADQGEPVITVDGAGNAYAAWTDQRNGNTDIYFAHRPAGGSWSNHAQVNDDPGTAAQSSPAIAVDGSGNAYAVWTDERDDYGDIYFAYRPTGGIWGANVRVNDDADAQGQWSPAIAVDGAGNAYAVWTDERDLSEIYFAYRPAGAAWGANERINDQLGAADPWGMGPAIAVDGTGNACVVWTDYRNENEDIYAVHRPAGGAWTANVLVNDDPGTAHSEAPAVAVDGAGNAYAVWADRRSGNWDIYFARRPAGGSWGTAVQVSQDPGTVDQWSPAIAVDGASNAYVVWEDERNDDGDIYFAYRPAGGTWGASVKVSDDPGAEWQWSPAIAVDSAGNAYAVWADERNDVSGDVYFARRPAGGAWSANVQVNDYPSVGGPDIDVDGAGNAYAVWEKDPGYFSDVYFAYRPAGGAWGADVKVNDDPGWTDQFDPAIAVDGAGNAYATWTDERNGGWDVYFAYRPAGGSWGANEEISPGRSWQTESALTVDGTGNAHAVWTGKQDSPNVYASYRLAGGNWGEPFQVGDDDGFTSSPNVAVDGAGKAYAVWRDWRDAAVGNWRTWHGTAYFAHSLPTPEYRSEGTYTSPVFDASVVAAWETLSWAGATPVDTTLFFETRSRLPGGAWSAWTPANSPIVSPPGQFLQVRATFSTASAGVTPVLDQVQVTYRATDIPSPTRFATPCGVTNQTNPTLRGSAVAGATVHLFVDGSEVLATTAGDEGDFVLVPNLAPGTYTLTATAENAHGTGPASDPLALTVDPALPYDPIGVRAGQWSKDGWLLAPPRDAQGCADPDDGWRVWPRANQPFRVEVPVSYTVSAAVDVTVGTDTIALTEVAAGTFAGVLAPPIAAGAFRIEITADGVPTVVDGGPVLIDPDGIVYEAGGTLDDPIPGVQVTLYYSDTHAGLWLPWDAWTYDQVNPQVTLDDGSYSFYTPPGTYRVVAEKAGYSTYTSPDLAVVDRPVRHNVPLGSLDWQIYLPLVSRNH